MDLSPAILATGCGLASAAAFGAADFAGGMAAKRANALGTVVFAHGLGLVLMLVTAQAAGEALPAPRSLAWGAAAGGIGGLGLAALYRALAIGKMGIAAPLTAILSAALPVLAGALTEGLPRTVQIAGFALALLAVWLISLPEGELGRPRGVGLALLAGLGFGGFLVLIRHAGQETVFWPLAAARVASLAVMFSIILASRARWVPPRAAMPAVLVAGALDVFGNVLFMWAAQRGRLDVAAVLSSLYPAATVVLARLLLKERIGRVQAVGMMLALAAVPMIAAR